MPQTHRQHLPTRFAIRRPSLFWRSTNRFRQSSTSLLLAGIIITFLALWCQPFSAPSTRSRAVQQHAGRISGSHGGVAASGRLGRRSEVPLADRLGIAIVSLCSDQPDRLCVRYNGELTKLSEEPTQFCPYAVQEDVYLGALQLVQYRRVVVHRPSIPVAEDHLHAAHVDEIVFSDPTVGNFADVWSVSPQKHRSVFELACKLMTIQRQNATLDGLFEKVSFSAAYFPQKIQGAAFLSQNSLQGTRSRAYATYLSSQAHDWYVEAVRLLNYKLQQLCPSEDSAPLVVMLLADRAAQRSVSQQSSFVPILEREGILVRVVEDVETGMQRDGRFVGIWAKQRFWQLVEFEKVVFFDPDHLLLRCPASLFKYPHFSHAQTLFSDNHTFNSGVLVVQPSLVHMRAVEQAVRSSSTDNDQLLTEWYFDGRGYSIPEFYSLYKLYVYMHTREWAVWKHCAHFIHFIMKKPWEGGEPPKCVPAYSRFFLEYQVFKRARPEGPAFEVPANVSMPEVTPELIDPNACPLQYLST